MDISLQPKDPAGLGNWIETVKAGYVENLVRSGMPLALAVPKAETSFEQCFPAGGLAAGHEVFEVTLLTGECVGSLWIGPQTEQPQKDLVTLWWVWDIVINEDHRGQGFGRQAMRLAEERVRQLGGKELGLNVFGFNAPARSLYESLGFEIASINMRKILT